MSLETQNRVDSVALQIEIENQRTKFESILIVDWKLEYLIFSFFSFSIDINKLGTCLYKRSKILCLCKELKQ